MKRIAMAALVLSALAGGPRGQAISARRLGPNLESKHRHAPAVIAGGGRFCH